MLRFCKRPVAGSNTHFKANLLHYFQQVNSERSMKANSSVLPKLKQLEKYTK